MRIPTHCYRIWALLLFLVPSIGACSNMRLVEWTEDVRISDQSRIKAQRSEEYRRVTDVGAGFQRGWLFQNSKIVADVPAPFARRVAWEGTLVPLTLAVLDRQLYLVNVVVTPIGRDEWRVPAGEYYVVFRFSESGWQRIPLAELPTSARPNLLPSAYKLFIEGNTPSGAHVGFETKDKVISDPRIGKRYRTILRKPDPDA